MRRARILPAAAGRAHCPLEAWCAVRSPSTTGNSRRQSILFCGTTDSRRKFRPRTHQSVSPYDWRRPACRSRALTPRHPPCMAGPWRPPPQTGSHTNRRWRIRGTGGWFGSRQSFCLPRVCPGRAGMRLPGNFCRCP